MVDPQLLKQKLWASLDAHDASRLASVVLLPPISPRKGPEPAPRGNADSLIVRNVDYGGLLAALIDAHAAAEAGYATKCYQAQSLVHSNVNRILSSSEGNWLIPTVIAVCKQTHKTAVAADNEDAMKGNRNAKLQNAVQLLQDSFSKTFNDRTEYNVSLCICFKFQYTYFSHMPFLSSVARCSVRHGWIKESGCISHCQ